jgi:SAM-dependent methyltransferase
MMADQRLNIGAGQTFLPGFRNIDIDSKAEIQLDLSKDRLPFDDGSVSLVFSYHTMEHIPDYLFALGELHRVLRHDGTLLLGLPYVSLTQYHLVNPYHLHNFNEHSFALFDDAKLKGSAEEQNDVIFKQVFCRFHYLRSFRPLPSPLKNWSRRHLFNVVRAFDVGLVAVKDRNAPTDLSDARGREMLTLFDQCLAARTPYPR